MIQIDMPMPDNCVVCRFNVSVGYCSAMPVEFVGRVSDCEEDGKPKWCPLKAQEPMVMTLEEVKQEHNCWIEDADDGMTIRLFPATMFGIGEYANGSKSYMFLAQKPWAIDVNDCEWWYLIEDYGQTWRCWTSRPDQATREATPWQE